jgi:hypothetical protein
MVDTAMDVEDGRLGILLNVPLPPEEKIPFLEASLRDYPLTPEERTAVDQYLDELRRKIKEQGGK